jgi:hypothetical protein
VAAKNRREISIQYRRLDGAVLSSPNFSLFRAVVDALNFEQESVKLRDDWRLRDFNYANEESLILNWFAHDDEYLIGEIVGVEPGGLLTAARRSASSKEFFEVGQVETPEGEEPYLGAVYFLIRGNHVLVAEDGLSAKRIESYLEWLLNGVTKITENFAVHLQPKVHVSHVDASTANATTITVKPKPFAPPTTSGNELLKFETGNAALDVLNAIGMDFKDFDQLVAEASDASIVLEIKLKFKRGLNSMLPAKLVSLDGLAANFDEDEIFLQGDKGTVQGKLVRANYKCPVRVENGQINKDDLRSAFGEAWDDFVNRRLIQPQSAAR